MGQLDGGTIEEKFARYARESWGTFELVVSCWSHDLLVNWFILLIRPERKHWKKLVLAEVGLCHYLFETYLFAGSQLPKMFEQKYPGDHSFALVCTGAQG